MDLKVVEQKYELASELGLYNVASALSAKIESEKMMKDIDNLIGMKFNKITIQEIEKKLHVPRVSFDVKRGMRELLHSNDYGWAFGIPFLTICAAVFIGAISGLAEGHFLIKMWWSITHIASWSIIPAVAGLVMASTNRIRRGTTRLALWDGQLPLGALLALKECKDRKLSNKLTIHFPRILKEVVRFTDPVITSELPNGELIEVFAWDDGKVYEEDVVETVARSTGEITDRQVTIREH